MTYNKRATVVDGWVQVDQEDGSQIRARLVVDRDPFEPERGAGMWNEGVTLFRVEDNYRGTDLDHYAPMGNIMSIIENGEDDNTGEYRDETPWMRDKDQVSRYLRIFHDAQFAEIVTVQHFRDIAHILVVAEGMEDSANPEAIARGTLEEWSAWASGDVYMVEAQTRTLAQAMEDGDEDYSWTDDEDYPVGGYYGDESGREGIAEALGVSVDDVPGAYDITEY